MHPPGRRPCVFSVPWLFLLSCLRKKDDIGLGRHARRLTQYDRLSVLRACRSIYCCAEPGPGVLRSLGGCLSSWSIWPVSSVDGAWTARGSFNLLSSQCCLFPKA
ncbi:hypothetical protein BDW60DRAFT_180548 [Aspergillus nidulans var. acristatus]